ncbi:hypothetical protein A1O1_07427 [Capronia coronata CBS 617.96]|uniref:Pentatricopeptide repeat domain-containing protein n=1 Tax=Capronia coronata CBS 617.96 TaxID=1182541 RepID=W9Y2B9_9EURO|nr:uncharacterized protein A1O1_07427 [Capronia coronata CBS 617.96]EXJ83800.1 hypothetical protein A1O1_07427 [Capronia coronata CBS 617.96]
MSGKPTRTLRACLPLSLTGSFLSRIALRNFYSATPSYHPYHQAIDRKSLFPRPKSSSDPSPPSEQSTGASAADAVRSRTPASEVTDDDSDTKRIVRGAADVAKTTPARQSVEDAVLAGLPSYWRASQQPGSNTSTGQRTAADKLSTLQQSSERHFPSRLTKRFVNRKLPGPDATSALVPWSSRAATNAWSFPPASRHVPLEPGGDPYFLPNSNEFSQEWVRLYKSLTFPEDGDLSRARRELEAYRQAAVHFVGQRGGKALRRAWLRLGLNQRVKTLPSILIGCLTDSARMTLKFLSILPMLPREWKTRCECLTYLELVHGEEIKSQPDLQRMFARQIKHVSKVWSFPEGAMPRAFLALLLRHNSPEHCENIIDTVFQNSAPVPVPLILVVVDHFIKQGNPDRAVELLSAIPVDQREPFKQAILDRLTNLIGLDSVEDAEGGRNFKVLPRLMQIGLPLDANVHNRVLQQAVFLRLSNVAWEVFRFMEAENIHVDAKSHLVLLKDSFDRQDREKLDRILSAIHAREDLYRDPYLVAYTMHIVRIVCCFDRKLPPEVCFAHILAIYDRAYDRAPLVKLGLAEPLPAEQQSVSRLPEPRPAALGFTIWAYVLCQSDEKPVSRLWHWIAHLIQHKDTSICEAAKHDVLYNGFISFFSRQPSTLQKGLEVVEEMIELGLCEPSQRTWSEVLCGFLRHGEEGAAERVWRTMLAKGQLPSGSEWSFLLNRYEKSRLSRLVRYVLDERQIPEGLDAHLGSPDPLDAATGEAQKGLVMESEYEGEEGMAARTFGAPETVD